MIHSFSAQLPNLRTQPARVSLASRARIESLDAGLTSVEGAQQVIKDILARKSVTKLILGHNDLGDQGCEELFGFLASDAGRKYKVEEISLNANNIGNRGLLAICKYLRDNTSLKELFLQNNAFIGDTDVAIVFALAVNSSSLESLSLATNLHLRDTFAASFLPLLNSPTLGTLHMSVLGMTHHSTSYIIEYLTSPRCHLHTFKASANDFRRRAIQSIVRAVRRANYTLTRLELYATGFVLEPHEASDEGTSEDGEQTWQDFERELKSCLVRNSTLKRLVEKEALDLLRYSRVLLLRFPDRDGSTLLVQQLPCSASSSCALDARRAAMFAGIGQPVALGTPPPSPPPPPAPLSAPFARLPTELKLHILSFLAPNLSLMQRIRVFTYASSPATLPALLPCLPSSGGCIPDPASPAFGLGGFGADMGTSFRRQGGGSVSACASGKCMGAGNNMRCRRQSERDKWLVAVGCTAYELEKLEGPEIGSVTQNPSALQVA